MRSKKKRTGSARNRSSKTVKSCLGFLGVGRFVSCLVDKLEELGSVVVSRKSVSDLLAILRLADHFLLPDHVVRDIDVRARLQIIKLHKSLLGRGYHTAILQTPLRLAQSQVHLKLRLALILPPNEQYCFNLVGNQAVSQIWRMPDKVYCTILFRRLLRIEL